ncbi:hypothetical protein ABT299_22415 [Spirillospora sp. NPDC000708]
MRSAVEDLNVTAGVFDMAAGELLRSLACEDRATPRTERDQSYMDILRKETGASDDAILAALADIAADLLGLVDDRLRQHPNDSEVEQEEPAAEPPGQDSALAGLPSDSARIRHAVQELGLGLDARPATIARWLQERGVIVSGENIRSVMRRLRTADAKKRDAHRGRRSGAR